MKKRDFESEIGAKCNKFRAKIALLEALSCLEKEENGRKKAGKP